MRAKASKAHGKTMTLFRTVYGFHQPFQILLDADFVQMAASQKMEVAQRLEATLQGKVKLMITQCSMEHLYARGVAGQSAVELARTIERRKCNHWEAKEAEDDCIAGLVGDQNKLRYVVVTQSAALRERLRSVPGTPLLYINPRSILLLEAPSEAAVHGKKQLEEGKRHAPQEDLAVGPRRHTVEQKMHLGKRKRKVANPNPLSVKKKKTQKRKVGMTGATREILPLRTGKRKAEDGGSAETKAHKKRRRSRKPSGAADE